MLTNITLKDIFRSRVICAKIRQKVRKLMPHLFAVKQHNFTLAGIGYYLECSIWHLLELPFNLFYIFNQQTLHMSPQGYSRVE